MLCASQSNKLLNLSARSYFIGANKHKQRTTLLLKSTCVVIYYAQIEFHGLVSFGMWVPYPYTSRFQCNKIITRYRVLLHCAHTHRDSHSRLFAGVASKRENILSYYLWWMPSGTPQNSCIQKGKQIVRVTTINKSLHIYSVGKFSAFVYTYVRWLLFFFRRCGEKYKWILGYICSKSKCANEQIRNSHDEKNGDGEREIWHAMHGYFRRILNLLLACCFEMKWKQTAYGSIVHHFFHPPPSRNIYIRITLNYGNCQFYWIYWVHELFNLYTHSLTNLHIRSLFLSLISIKYGKHPLYAWKKFCNFFSVFFLLFLQNALIMHLKAKWNGKVNQFWVVIRDSYCAVATLLLSNCFYSCINA